MIVLNDINKKMNGNHVLQDISFHISPGERVGIIGKNGAGKTTLLNIIAGILKADSGFIRVDFVENTLEDYAVLRKISYVSGTRLQLWEDMPIKDSLAHCMRMYRVTGNSSQWQELIQVFGIEKFLNDVPRNLSVGERMRGELVYGLLSNPRVLLLDEVMMGLDVSAKYKIMQYLETYCREKGCLLLFTSHNLVEVEHLCERILLLDKGTIIFDGSVEKIMREYAPLTRMEIKLEGNVPDFEDLPLQKMKIENNRLHIWYDHTKLETTQILQQVLKQNKAAEIRIYEPNLEETITQIYER